MRKGGIEDPIIEKGIKPKTAKPKQPRLPDTGEGKKIPKIGKLRQSRLPETGEGNKPFEVRGPDENGRVMVRVLDTYFTLSYTVEGGKFRGHVAVGDERDSRFYNPSGRRLPKKLKKDALGQGFARLYEHAEERHPILKERRLWGEHKGRQRDLP